MLASSSTSSTTQLSQLGASLYGPQSTININTNTRRTTASCQNKSVCVFLASQTGSSRLTCPLALTCRCSGVSHAWDEQQHGTSVKSERPEPVGQPIAKSRQYGQHRHDAHAPLTEQVPYTNTHTRLTHMFLVLWLKPCPPFLQGNPAHEQPQRAQPQPAGGRADGADGWDGGRSRSREGRGRWRCGSGEEQQYGESQPVVAEHHRDAQTAAGAATVHHQQVTAVDGQFVSLSLARTV